VGSRSPRRPQPVPAAVGRQPDDPRFVSSCRAPRGEENSGNGGRANPIRDFNRPSPSTIPAPAGSRWTSTSCGRSNIRTCSSSCGYPAAEDDANGSASCSARVPRRRVSTSSGMAFEVVPVPSWTAVGEANGGLLRRTGRSENHQRRLRHEMVEPLRRRSARVWRVRSSRSGSVRGSMSRSTRLP